MSGIRITDKPTIPVVDALFGVRQGSTGLIGSDALATQIAGTGAVAARLEELRSQITSGLLVAATWSDLEQLAGSVDGEGAEVLDSDGGTHGQATATGYDGDTADNAGRYSWKASWGRWVRIGDTGLAGKASLSAVQTHATATDNPHGVTAAQIGVEAGADVTDAENVGATIHGRPGKASIADTDTFAGIDSEDDDALVKWNWMVVKTGIRNALGGLIAAATAKETPTDGDLLAVSDSAASDATKKLSLLTLWNYIKDKADASYATAAQGGRADTAVQPGDLSTVATSGSYADLADLPPLGTAAAQAATAFATAAQGATADAAAPAIDLVTQAPATRPGEAPQSFGTAVIGAAADIDPAIDTGGVTAIEDGTLGRAIQIENVATWIAPRQPTAVRPGRVYRPRFVARRSEDPADPLSDGVEVGIRWLAQDKTGLTGGAGDRVLQVTGMPSPGIWVSDDVTLSIDVSGVDHTIPSAAVYGRPWIRTYGTDHVTVVSEIELVDITEAFLLVASLGTASQEDAAAFATAAQGGRADTAVQPGDLSAVATSGSYDDLSGKPVLGTAAAQAADTFASAAQGGRADTAVQPGDLSAVATSGSYGDLSGKPVLGTAAAQAADAFASAAQGGRADTAVQPGDLSAVATSGSYGDLSGKPVLGTAAAQAADAFASAAQGGKADTAVQPAALEAEVALRASGDTALSQGLAALDAETSHALAGKAALVHDHAIAAIDGLEDGLASAAAGHQPQPGMHPTLFRDAASGGSAYGAGDTVSTAEGPALRLVGEALAVLGRRVQIGPEDADELRFRVMRSASIEDPAGDGVRFGVICYGATGAPLPGASGFLVLATEVDIDAEGETVGLRRVVGRGASGAVETTLPAACRSYAPAVRSYGANPGLDVITLERQRITAAAIGIGVGADAAGPLAARGAHDGEASGFIYAAVGGGDWEYYIRTGESGWSGPQTFKGATGQPGLAPEEAERLLAMLTPEGGLALPSLDAVGAITMDAASGEVLAALTPDATGFPASTTKAMMALVASRHVVDWSEEITVQAEDEDGSVMIEGDVVTLEGLLNCAMIVSNDASCDIIARHVGPLIDPETEDPIATFIAAMNTQAAALGMDATTYTRTFGDSEGAEITARDLATLWRYIYRNAPLIVEISEKSGATLTRTGPNARTTTLRHSFDWIQAGNVPAVGGGKTGTSGFAGANLVWHGTSRDGRPLIHALIGSTDDTSRHLAAAAVQTRALRDWTYIGALPVQAPSTPYVPPRVVDWMTGPQDILGTWTRAGSATYIDDNGHLADAGPDVPRYDHGPNSLGLRGALYEPARTNAVPNGIGKGSVAADGVELNDQPTFAAAGSWVLSDTGGASSAEITGGNLVLTGDAGFEEGRADLQLTGLTAGLTYVVEFPEGVNDQAISARVGETQGDNALSGTLVIQTGGWRAFTFVASAPTAWVRLARISSGSALIPACSIQSCGKLPAGWEYTGLVGVVPVVVAATRNVEGYDAIDLRLRGTPQVNGTAFINFGSGSDSAAAVAGTVETWATSLHMRRISGATTNVEILQRISERDENGDFNTVFASNSIDGIAAPPARLSQSRTWVNKGIVNHDTSYLLLGLTIGVTAGDPFDLTVQIANPQMERYREQDGSIVFGGPTSVIRSDPDDADTWTRSADIWTVTGLAAGRYLQHSLMSTERDGSGTALPVSEVQ